jgi:hypothetical protein
MDAPPRHHHHHHPHPLEQDNFTWTSVTHADEFGDGDVRLDRLSVAAG